MVKGSFPSFGSLAFVALFIGAESALAQGPPAGAGLPRTPTFSPYLNLLRRDNSTALNYYGLVRPQIAFREGLQDLDQQQQSYLNDQQNAPNSASKVLPPTGHSTGFLTHRRYFLTKSSVGFGGGGGGYGPNSLGGGIPGGGFGGGIPGGGGGFGAGMGGMGAGAPGGGTGGGYRR